MKQLTAEAQDAVLAWLEEFELSKPARAKTLGRDFSDGVLLAQVLKQLYPKLVELHNYPQRNSFTLKLDNWNTLNRKVLRKLDITLAPDTLAQLCNAVPGVLERVCHDIMLKYRADERAGRYDDDATSENTDIMCVNVSKRSLNGSVQQVVQKMVTYALYEKSQTTVYEQQQAITILTQKIEHLDNLLKLKCQRIDDLLGQLARKPISACRLKVKSELTLCSQQQQQLLQQQPPRQSLLDIVAGASVKDADNEPLTTTMMLLTSSGSAGGIGGFGGGCKSDGPDSTRSLMY